jgi:hypothetical protein
MNCRTNGGNENRGPQHAEDAKFRGTSDSLGASRSGRSSARNMSFDGASRRLRPCLAVSKNHSLKGGPVARPCTMPAGSSLDPPFLRGGKLTDPGLCIDQLGGPMSANRIDMCVSRETSTPNPNADCENSIRPEELSERAGREPTSPFIPRKKAVGTWLPAKNENDSGCCPLKRSGTEAKSITRGPGLPESTDPHQPHSPVQRDAYGPHHAQGYLATYLPSGFFSRTSRPLTAHPKDD